ncbi:hypothetical protein AU461_23145 [Vibrio parahaemolyticus]|nr:hypothetical protein AU461_23145 [Vibrio parahaemolyticus]KYX47739.1 hypothetical protein AU389_02045 [Vibrio parahaemolyticus]
MSQLPQSKNCSGTTKTDHKQKQFVIVLRIKVAFWVPIYLKTLVLFCWTFGTQPDPVKVAQTVRKGIKVMLPQHKRETGFKAVLTRLLFPFSHPQGVGKSL